MSDDWNSFSSPVAPAQPKKTPASGDDLDSFSSPVAGATTPADAPPLEAPKLGFSDDEKHQVSWYIPKAKDGADLDAYARKLTNGRVGISNAKDIVQYYKDYQKVPNSFVDNAEGTDKEPVTAGMYAKDFATHVGHGLMSTLGFVDDAVLDPILNVGDLVKKPLEIYHDIVNPPSKEQLKARIADEQAKNSIFSRAAGNFYDKHVADSATPERNTTQRYANNVGEFAGGSLVPMGELNGARGLAGLATGAVTGGIANQAAKDAFPDNQLVQDLAGIAGAHVGATPFALKPIRDNAYVSDASQHPEAAYVPQAVQALSDKAADVAPNGLTPKGRGKLTVAQINSVAKQHLIGMPDDLNRLVRAGTLDAEHARTLKLAIQNKDGITAPEIDALRGTPEGDAVAEALNHYRAVSNLTKPYGGSKPANHLATVGEWALNLGAYKATGDPFALATGTAVKTLGKMALQKLTGPQDVNASRIRGADKAINALPNFQRLGDKTGPTNLQPAMDTFQQRVADTYQPQDEPAPTQRPLPLKDRALQEQIDQGLKGDGGGARYFADVLNVKPEDVLRVAPHIDLPAEMHFERTKLVNGYTTSRGLKEVLTPRLRKALTDDGTIAARAAETKAPKPSEKPTQISDTPKAAEPVQPAATPAPEAETGLNYKNVRRETNHNAGRARFQANFDRTVNDHAMKNDGPILSDAATGISYMRDTAKTTNEAMEYFDSILGPKLRNKGYEPEQIDHLREALHEAATVGKPYRTQADLEKGAMTKGPGRPKKPQPSDDVPF